MKEMKIAFLKPSMNRKDPNSVVSFKDIFSCKQTDVAIETVYYIITEAVMVLIAFSGTPEDKSLIWTLTLEEMQIAARYLMNGGLPEHFIAFRRSTCNQIKNTKHTQLVAWNDSLLDGSHDNDPIDKLLLMGLNMVVISKYARSLAKADAKDSKGGRVTPLLFRMGTLVSLKQYQFCEATPSKPQSEAFGKEIKMLLDMCKEDWQPETFDICKKYLETAPLSLIASGCYPVGFKETVSLFARLMNLNPNELSFFSSSTAGDIGHGKSVFNGTQQAEKSAQDFHSKLYERPGEPEKPMPRLRWLLPGKQVPQSSEKGTSKAQSSQINDAAPQIVPNLQKKRGRPPKYQHNDGNKRRKTSNAKEMSGQLGFPGPINSLGYSNYMMPVGNITKYMIVGNHSNLSQLSVPSHQGQDLYAPHMHSMNAVIGGNQPNDQLLLDQRCYMTNRLQGQVMTPLYMPAIPSASLRIESDCTLQTGTDQHYHHEQFPSPAPGIPLSHGIYLAPEASIHPVAPPVQEAPVAWMVPPTHSVGTISPNNDRDTNQIHFAAVTGTQESTIAGLCETNHNHICHNVPPSKQVVGVDKNETEQEEINGQDEMMDMTLEFIRRCQETDNNRVSDTGNSVAPTIPGSEEDAGRSSEEEHLEIWKSLTFEVKHQPIKSESDDCVITSYKKGRGNN